MHTAITAMLPGGRGRIIINVASVAALHPEAPAQRSKILMSISESAHLRYAPRGHRHGSLPGPHRSDQFTTPWGKQLPSSGFLWLAHRGVTDAIAASHRGKALCVPHYPW